MSEIKIRLRKDQAVELAKMITDWLADNKTGLLELTFQTDDMRTPPFSVEKGAVPI